MFFYYRVCVMICVCHQSAGNCGFGMRVTDERTESFKHFSFNRFVQPSACSPIGVHNCLLAAGRFKKSINPYNFFSELLKIHFVVHRVKLQNRQVRRKNVFRKRLSKIWLKDKFCNLINKLTCRKWFLNEYNISIFFQTNI